MTFAKLLITSCFLEHLQWLLLKVSGFHMAYSIHTYILNFVLSRTWFPACNFIDKRLQQRCFHVKFAKFLRTCLLLTEHLLMTTSCVYLWILRSFSEHFFYREPPENSMLYHVQVAEFQPPDTVKSYSTDAFQAFYKRTRSSHSKAFIYLKSLKTVFEEVYL